MTNSGSLARSLTFTITLLGLAALPAGAAPKINFSTFLGGAGADNVDGLAVDTDGRAFVLSCTTDPEGYANGTIALSPNAGEVDLVITRLNRKGKLERSVSLGGSAFDGCLSIALGPDPHDPTSVLVYVLGSTFSKDFPTRDPIQDRCAGTGGCSGDLTITILDADLTEILFSTYLGGSGREFSPIFDFKGGLAVDRDGRIAVAASSESKDYPTRRPTQKRAKGDASAVVSVLEPLPAGGYRVSFSTFLGGNVKKSLSFGRTVAFGPDGLLVVAGSTDDRRFPALMPLQDRIGGGASDGFVAVYDLDGASALGPAGKNRGNRNGDPSLLFSTTLGGREYDALHDLAVDGSRAYLTGATLSPDFPTQNPFQPRFGGVADALLIALDLGPTLATGGAPKVIVSSFFGGRFDDRGGGIAVDRRGIVHLAGTTFSRDLPTRSAVQSQCAQHPSSTPDCWDGFVTRFEPIRAGAPPQLRFSSFLGGPGQRGVEAGGDILTGIAVDRKGASYVVGRTNSSKFPTRRAAQKRKRGIVDGCLTQIKK